MRYREGQLLFVCLATGTTRAVKGLSFPNCTRLATIGKSKVKALFSSAVSNDMSSEQTTPKSWRSLLEVSIAKTRKIRGSNYVQLATVEDGEPRCRTVVFRGFQKLPSEHALAKECDSLPTTFKMCTDLRSKKVSQNEEQSIAEILWWFPKTNEQYRVRGQLILVGDETAAQDRALAIARKEMWGNISDPMRETFFETVVPGEPFEEEPSVTEIPKGGREEDGKLLPPPKNFLLMLLDPFHVDYLYLSSDQYRQDDILVDGDWTQQRINP